MGELVPFTKPDVEPLRESGTALTRRAIALVVLDAESDGEALELIQLATEAERAVDDKLGPIIDAAHKAHKGLTTLRAELKAPLLVAKGTATAKHSEYVEAAERAAAEAAAALEAEARKAEEERILAEATAAEAAGDENLAESILAEPVSVPTAYVRPATARVAGISDRETWAAEVVDLEALVRFVAANPSWLALLMPNNVALNAAARAQRGGLKIPGVRAVRRTSVAVRR